MKGLDILALILVLSYAIDLVVKATLFLLAFLGPWRRLVPDPVTLEHPPSRAAAEKRAKLVYFVFAGLLGFGGVVIFGNVRIIDALGYEPNNAILDAIATGIILIGGSDLIRNLVQISGIGRAADGKSKEPLEITGKLTIEGGTPRRD